MKSVISRLVVCLILVSFLLQGFSSVAIGMPKMPVANLQELPPDDSFENPGLPPSFFEADNLLPETRWEAELGLTEPERREFKPASPELIAQTHAEVMAFDCEIVEDVPPEECEVLLDLYAATAGAGWKNNDGWFSGANVGDWYGITVSNGNVEKIDFWYNDLVGTIPESLESLSKLTRLNLSVNSLTGSIPTVLSKLDNLVFLYLNGNQLSGSIPEELGNLENFIELYLNNNELSGSIPKEIGNLQKLTFLDLRINQLGGPIPEELGYLKNLVHLHLEDNRLSGSIPAALGDLENLIFLHLYKNRLTGSIPEELGDLNRLIAIYLFDNQLSGSIPEELGKLENLKYLHLYNNQLSGSIPEELGELKRLNYLHLHNNQLSGSIPKELGNLENLQTLNLAMNQLEGEVPEEIGELTSLILLDLRLNAFSGKLPNSITGLTLCTDCYFGYNRLDEDQSAEILSFLETKDPNWLSSQAVSFSIVGAAGGVVGSRDNSVRLDIPAGAFAGEDEITFAPHLQAWEVNTNFVPTMLNFKLYPSSLGSPANSLSSDLIVDIYYGGISLDGIPEEDLHIHYYDYAANPGRWVPVEEICGNTIYERDPDIDRISLNLCRLGEFALGGQYSIFLPLVLK